MGEVYDDHYAEMMWEHGNPYIMSREPFADTPEFGGMQKYLERHGAFDLPCNYKCKFCGEMITFSNRKAIDKLGAPHLCLTNKLGG